jgi:hypothetical protein
MSLSFEVLPIGVQFRVPVVYRAFLCKDICPMGLRAKRILVVVVLCTALAAAFVVVLTGTGTRHAASSCPSQVAPRSLTFYAEPQITYCTSITRISLKSLPTSFPARSPASCKREISSTKSG